MRVLLIVVFLLNGIFCIDDIILKFHQRTYKVKDIRAQTIGYDKNYVNFFEAKAFKYNRTTTAINATLNLKESVEDQWEILVQAYKFLSNEYRRVAIRFQLNLKKLFDANAGGMHGIRKCGNITNFVFYKEITYHMCNFVIDETQLPPFIPNGMYKLDVKFLYLNKETARIHLFCEIYTPMMYPKN